MSLQTEIAMMVALMPFLMVWALLDLSRRIQRRREDRIARQIALTDAIHRELGAAAAPEVWRSWRRGWIVSVQLPLRREDTVGAVTRIAHDLFRRLDRQDPPRLRIMLIPQEGRTKTVESLRGGGARLRRVA